MPADPNNDRQDFLALRGGDDLALNRLIERWERSLIGFAYRYVLNEAEARDLAAEVFVRFYENRLALREDTNVSAWLFTTLANLCRNQLRWRRRHPTVTLDAADDADATGASLAETLATEGLGPDQLYLHREVLEAVKETVLQLPHDLKVTVLLYYYERMSYREISEVIACSERGVETRLYRARALMKPVLARYLEKV